MKYKGVLIIILIFYTPAVKAQLTYNELIVQYDSAWTFKNLKLIPIRFKTPSDGDPSVAPQNVISFKEALRTGKMSVKEMSTPQGSDVNVLLVRNHSKKNVLVNSGEILAGGKQDRVVAQTAVISAEQEFYLPVFCIEKGRWDDKAKSFTYAGSADSKLKKQIDVSQKQNEVWKEIDRQFKSKEKTSDTWPYLDLHRNISDADTSYLRFFMDKMKNSDSLFAGFVGITGNSIINCEIFSNTTLCLISYESLVKTYVRAISSKPDTPKVPVNEIQKFLDKFLKSSEQQKRYLSSYGRIDKYLGNIIHIVAYDD